MTDETKHLEEENNHIFIEAYGLQDELTPEVPLEEITLTCNPYYRYKGNYTVEEREARLLEDTIKEFLSYAVGCMFGRYSLDKPGLILANQGETLKDYLRIISKEPLFTPTDTNVLPILDGDWFADDIVARFKQFLKVTFGEPNYEENLRFIEEALGKDLRRYFLKDFYKDHVQMYKKRPIYWLFSSPKGSFNALIYMHRYTQDTVSVVLNQYLREFKEKLGAHRKRLEAVVADSSTTSREKAQTLKERESVSLVLQELKDYEEHILFPLAAQRININLDDGVKVNYPKFGDALAKIPGLSEKGI
jgi:type II restriction/modification system DNA methylase subunit YeeA